MDWITVLSAAVGGALGGGLASLTRTKSKALRIVLTVVPVVLAIQLAPFVAGKLRDRFAPATKVQAAIRKYYSDPQTIDLLTKATDGMSYEQGRLFGLEKSHAGLKRLPPEDLKRWNAIRLSLADTSATLCAGFWTGKGITTENLQAALNSLSDRDADDWTRITRDAMTLEMTGKPVPGVNTNRLHLGLTGIARGLSADERRRFEQVSMEGTNAGADDACWAMKLVLRAATENKAPFGEPFLRALASI